MSWEETSSNDTLNGEEVERTKLISELPSGAGAPGIKGLVRLMEVISDIFKLRLASAVSSFTQKRTWSPSIVRGVVALVI